MLKFSLNWRKNSVFKTPSVETYNEKDRYHVRKQRKIKIGKKNFKMYP